MNLYVKNPANGEQLCMDVNPLNAKPGVNDLFNGVKLVLNQCDKSERFGGPTDLNAFGVIEYWVWYYPDDGTGLGTGQLCVDLTGGDKTNRNVLQLWSCNPECTKGWKNQVWSRAEV
ncbi:hypothetical protein BDV98DRAFT_598388 [Pterulicium gracile]|uniref:Uncharacterized protein n=1 Tax=Pterulicium gracile TaxID=1884261 RepID=A0A5C3Q291_9AGAR|nr:hypothetical protein BDV98DRAFT_598388 [Pterula gracilis]